MNVALKSCQVDYLLRLSPIANSTVVSKSCARDGLERWNVQTFGTRGVYLCLAIITKHYSKQTTPLRGVVCLELTTLERWNVRTFKRSAQLKHPCSVFVEQQTGVVAVEESGDRERAAARANVDVGDARRFEGLPVGGLFVEWLVLELVEWLVLDDAADIIEVMVVTQALVVGRDRGHGGARPRHKGHPKPRVRALNRLGRCVPREGEGVR